MAASDHRLTNEILVANLLAGISIGKEKIIRNFLRKNVYVRECLVKATTTTDKEFSNYITNPAYVYNPLGYAIVQLRSNTEAKTFKSIKGEGRTPGVCAEKFLLENIILANEIEDVKTISLTYSPCSSCTVCLILVFLFQQPKPSIRYRCDNRSERHERTKNNLELLSQYGFETEGTWDFRDLMINADPNATTDLTVLLCSIIGTITQDKMQSTSKECKIEQAVIITIKSQDFN